MNATELSQESLNSLLFKQRVRDLPFKFVDRLLTISKDLSKLFVTLCHGDASCTLILINNKTYVINLYTNFEFYIKEK